MNIVFMGTPEFAVPSLRILVESGYHISAVVTQPDRPKGRKHVLTPSAVKLEAMQLDIPVLQPEKLKDPDAIQTIEKLKPDLIVTAAYGQILPKAILNLPQYGCINVHGSLLPKYRGGAPIQHAIIRGEQVTGITIMYMNEGLDTGDIIQQREIPITEQDTSGTLFAKLSIIGAQLLQDIIPMLIHHNFKATPQNHSQASYAPNLKRDDEKIDWTRPAFEISCLIRGLHPNPGAFTTFHGEIIKIWRCKHIGQSISIVQKSNTSPGTILQATPEGIDVMTGNGILRLLEIQPAGKKTMQVEQFILGTKLHFGDQFD